MIAHPLQLGIAACCRLPARAVMCAIVLCLGCVLPVNAAELVIQGLPPALESNVRLTTGVLPQDGTPAMRRFLRALPDRTRQALAALGYYSANIRISEEIVAVAPANDAGTASAARPQAGSTTGSATAASDTNSTANTAAKDDSSPDSSSATTSTSPAGSNTTNDSATPTKSTTTTESATPTNGNTSGNGTQPASTTAPAAPTEKRVITMTVELGDPVRIDVVNLNITGPARTDPDYMKALGRLPLRRYGVFVSADYESAKSILIDAAQERGYFDFRFTTNEVRVSRRQLTADIHLIADSGTRYTFGEIQFEQQMFNPEFLQRWVPFSPGDPYEADDLATLTQNLQDSGYFASVRVLPQRDRRHGTTVPVKVQLEARDNNEVGIGIGYATDTGPRIKLTWSKPHINRAGHSLDAALGISAVKQNLSLAYRIPRDRQPLHNYWGIEYGLQNEKVDDSESFLSTLNFQRVRRLGSDWDESIFIRWERERSSIGSADPKTTNLVLPGFNYSRSRSRGTPFLTWGQSESFLLMAGRENLLSSIDIVKGLVQLKFLRAVSERNTLILAAQYGAIHTDTINDVPASQRFFAGGDRSVRGFAYRDISPIDEATGEAIGGLFLEVLSAEHNYRFRDLWSFATFIDAGRAFNDIDEPYSMGAGVGVRWQSPVGPFRLDFARPVSNNADGSWRVHLSLGPDL